MDLIKNIQIIYALFPLFFTMILLGLILKKGWNYLQRYKWFWFVGMIITGIVCIEMIFSSNVKAYMIIMAMQAFINCYSAYILLTKKDKRKNK